MFLAIIAVKICFMWLQYGLGGMFALFFFTVLDVCEFHKYNLIWCYVIGIVLRSFVDRRYQLFKKCKLRTKGTKKPLPTI